MQRTLMAVTLVSIAVVTGHAFQWQQWRGPTRDGIVPAANVPATWPEKPTLKWKQPAGEGYSSPVVDAGRIFVHSRQDPQEIVTAFDLASGKQLWRASYAAAFTRINTPPRWRRDRFRRRSSQAAASTRSA